jgi:hypothetical protein
MKTNRPKLSIARPDQQKNAQNGPARGNTPRPGTSVDLNKLLGLVREDLNLTENQIAGTEAFALKLLA